MADPPINIVFGEPEGDSRLITAIQAIILEWFGSVLDTESKEDTECCAGNVVQLLQGWESGDDLLPPFLARHTRHDEGAQ